MPDITPQPQLVSLRTIATKGGESFDWHTHPFDEFTLVTDDATLIGHAPGWRPTQSNTLLHYRAGEKHGGWVSPNQRPRFWVVHFTWGEAGSTFVPELYPADPGARAWNLTPAQVESFQWIFLQLLNEHTSTRPLSDSAASAWLQLLLVSVHRWARHTESPAMAAPGPAPARANAEVLRLWHRIHESVSRSNEELAALFSAPNYDSVRHAFRKSFGCSPREMLIRLRMEHAKNLLLETMLSVKEVAAATGYPRQHDFNRVFNRHVGMAPTRWRSNPLARLGQQGGEGNRGSCRQVSQEKAT